MVMALGSGEAKSSKQCKLYKEKIVRKEKLILLLKELLRVKDQTTHENISQQLLSLRSRGQEASAALKKELFLTCNSTNSIAQQQEVNRKTIEELSSSLDEKCGTITHLEFQNKQLVVVQHQHEKTIETLKESIKALEKKVGSCSSVFKVKKKKSKDKSLENPPPTPAYSVSSCPETSKAFPQPNLFTEGILTPASSISSSIRVPDGIASPEIGWLDLDSRSNSPSTSLSEVFDDLVPPLLTPIESAIKKPPLDDQSMPCLSEYDSYIEPPVVSSIDNTKELKVPDIGNGEKSEYHTSDSVGQELSSLSCTSADLVNGDQLMKMERFGSNEKSEPTPAVSIFDLPNDVFDLPNDDSESEEECDPSSRIEPHSEQSLENENGGSILRCDLEMSDNSDLEHHLNYQLSFASTKIESSMLDTLTCRLTEEVLKKRESDKPEVVIDHLKNECLPDLTGYMSVSSVTQDAKNNFESGASIDSSASENHITFPHSSLVESGVHLTEKLERTLVDEVTHVSGEDTIVIENPVSKCMSSDVVSEDCVADLSTTGDVERTNSSHHQMSEDCVADLSTTGDVERTYSSHHQMSEDCVADLSTTGDVERTNSSHHQMSEDCVADLSTTGDVEITYSSQHQIPIIDRVILPIQSPVPDDFYGFSSDDSSHIQSKVQETIVPPNVLATSSPKERPSSGECESQNEFRSPTRSEIACNADSRKGVRSRSQEKEDLGASGYVLRQTRSMSISPKNSTRRKTGQRAREPLSKIIVESPKLSTRRTRQNSTLEEGHGTAELRRSLRINSSKERHSSNPRRRTPEPLKRCVEPVHSPKNVAEQAVDSVVMSPQSVTPEDHFSSTSLKNASYSTDTPSTGSKKSLRGNVRRTVRSNNEYTVGNESCNEADQSCHTAFKSNFVHGKSTLPSRGVVDLSTETDTDHSSPVLAVSSSSKTYKSSTSSKLTEADSPSSDMSADISKMTDKINSSGNAVNKGLSDLTVSKNLFSENNSSREPSESSTTCVRNSSLVGASPLLPNEVISPEFPEVDAINTNSEKNDPQLLKLTNADKIMQPLPASKVFSHFRDTNSGKSSANSETSSVPEALCSTSPSLGDGNNILCSASAFQSFSSPLSKSFCSGSTILGGKSLANSETSNVPEALSSTFPSLGDGNNILRPADADFQSLSSPFSKSSYSGSTILGGKSLANSETSSVPEALSSTFPSLGDGNKVLRPTSAAFQSLSSPLSKSFCSGSTIIGGKSLANSETSNVPEALSSTFPSLGGGNNILRPASAAFQSLSSPFSKSSYSGSTILGCQNLPSFSDLKPNESRSFSETNLYWKSGANFNRQDASYLTHRQRKNAEEHLKYGTTEDDVDNLLISQLCLSLNLLSMKPSPNNDNFFNFFSKFKKENVSPVDEYSSAFLPSRPQPVSLTEGLSSVSFSDDSKFTNYRDGAGSLNECSDTSSVTIEIKQEDAPFSLKLSVPAGKPLEPALDSLCGMVREVQSKRSPYGAHQHLARNSRPEPGSCVSTKNKCAENYQHTAGTFQVPKLPASFLDRSNRSQSNKNCTNDRFISTNHQFKIEKKTVPSCQRSNDVIKQRCFPPVVSPQLLSSSIFSASESIKPLSESHKLVRPSDFELKTSKLDIDVPRVAENPSKSFSLHASDITSLPSRNIGNSVACLAPPRSNVDVDHTLNAAPPETSGPSNDSNDYPSVPTESNLGQIRPTSPFHLTKLNQNRNSIERAAPISSSTSDYHITLSSASLLEKKTALTMEVDEKPKNGVLTDQEPASFLDRSNRSQSNKNCTNDRFISTNHQFKIEKKTMPSCQRSNDAIKQRCFPPVVSPQLLSSSIFSASESIKPLSESHKLVRPSDFELKTSKLDIDVPRVAENPSKSFSLHASDITSLPSRNIGNSVACLAPPRSNVDVDHTLNAAPPETSGPSNDSNDYPSVPTESNLGQIRPTSPFHLTKLNQNRNSIERAAPISSSTSDYHITLSSTSLLEKKNALAMEVDEKPKNGVLTDQEPVEVNSCGVPSPKTKESGCGTSEICTADTDATVPPSEMWSEDAKAQSVPSIAFVSSENVGALPTQLSPNLNKSASSSKESDDSSSEVVAKKPRFARSPLKKVCKSEKVSSIPLTEEQKSEVLRRQSLGKQSVVGSPQKSEVSVMNPPAASQILRSNISPDLGRTLTDAKPKRMRKQVSALRSSPRKSVSKQSIAVKSITSGAMVVTDDDPKENADHVKCSQCHLKTAFCSCEVQRIMAEMVYFCPILSPLPDCPEFVEFESPLPLATNESSCSGDNKNNTMDLSMVKKEEIEAPSGPVEVSTTIESCNRNGGTKLRAKRKSRKTEENLERRRSGRNKRDEVVADNISQSDDSKVKSEISAEGCIKGSVNLDIDPVVDISNNVPSDSTPIYTGEDKSHSDLENRVTSECDSDVLFTTLDGDTVKRRLRSSTRRLELVAPEQKGKPAAPKVTKRSRPGRSRKGCSSGKNADDGNSGSENSMVGGKDAGLMSSDSSGCCESPTRSPKPKEEVVELVKTIEVSRNRSSGDDPVEDVSQKSTPSSPKADLNLVKLVDSRSLDVESNQKCQIDRMISSAKIETVNLEKSVDMLLESIGAVATSQLTHHRVEHHQPQLVGSRATLDPLSHLGKFFEKNNSIVDSQGVDGPEASTESETLGLEMDDDSESEMVVDYYSGSESELKEEHKKEKNDSAPPEEIESLRLSLAAEKRTTPSNQSGSNVTSRNYLPNFYTAVSEGNNTDGNNESKCSPSDETPVPLQPPLQLPKFYTAVQEETKVASQDEFDPKNQKLVKFSSDNKIFSKLISEEDIIPCSINILAFASFYDLKDVPDQPFKFSDPYVKYQQKIENCLKEYFLNSNLHSDLKKAVSTLRKMNASHIGKALCTVVGGSLLKIEPDEKKGTPSYFSKTQKKAVLLVTALANGRLQYFNEVLNEIEEFLIPSPKSPTCAPPYLATNVASFYALICRTQGFGLRVQSFIYDLLYGRHISGFRIIHQILLAIPQAIPCARNLMGPLTFTMVYLIMKQGIYKSLAPQYLITYGVTPLRKRLTDKYGYSFSADITRDTVMEELISNVMVKGCDKAIILLSKSQGYKWTFGVVQKYIFPVIDKWLSGEEADEDLVAQFIRLLGLVSRCFAVSVCESFVSITTGKFRSIIQKNPSLLIFEAVTEALVHFKRLNQENVIKILANWTPHDHKITKSCIRTLKKLMRDKPYSYWKQFMES